MHSPGWLDSYPDFNMLQIRMSVVCTAGLFIWTAGSIDRGYPTQAVVLGLLTLACGVMSAFLMIRRRWLYNEMITGKKVGRTVPLERVTYELSDYEMTESNRLLKSALTK